MTEWYIVKLVADPAKLYTRDISNAYRYDQVKHGIEWPSRGHRDSFDCSVGFKSEVEDCYPTLRIYE